MKLGRVNSDVLFRWFVGAHFGGGSLDAYIDVSLLMQGDGSGCGDSSPCSHSTLTLLWKGTLFQGLILETRVVPPFHCCSSSLCPFPGPVRARQDCTSAHTWSKRKHETDNVNAVTEHSKLFWLITTFVSPFSTYKCSRRNCNFF